MKTARRIAFIIAAALLLITPIYIQGMPIPVNDEYEKEGEASAGWHGLLPIINDFLMTIREGKEEKAYYTYTTEELQSKTPLKEFLQIDRDKFCLKRQQAL